MFTPTHVRHMVKHLVVFTLSLLLVLTTALGSSVAVADTTITPEVALSGIYPHYTGGTGSYSLDYYVVKYTVTMDKPRLFGMKQTANTMGVQLLSEDTNSPVASGNVINGYAYSQQTTYVPDGYTSIFTPTLSATNIITLSFKIPASKLQYWKFTSDMFKFDFMLLKEENGVYTQLTDTQESTTGTQTGSTIKTNWVGYYYDDGYVSRFRISSVDGSQTLPSFCVDGKTSTLNEVIGTSRIDGISTAKAKNYYFQKLSEDNPAVYGENGVISTRSQDAQYRPYTSQEEIIKHIKMALYYYQTQGSTDSILSAKRKKTKNYQHYLLEQQLIWMYTDGIASSNTAWKNVHDHYLYTGDTASISFKDTQTLFSRIEAQNLTQSQLDSITLTFWQGVGPTGSEKRPSQNQMTYEYNPNVVSLSVVKVDVNATTTRLAGATFTLKNSAGEVVSTQTSGADGTLTFRKLTDGTYMLQETVAPSGYDLNATVYTVTVAGGSFTIKDMQNNTVALNSSGQLQVGDKKTPVKGKFAVKKVDADDVSKTLAGATFELKLNSTSASTSFEKTTDSRGLISFEDLDPGQYLLKEKEAPYGYQLDSATYVIDVHDDGTVTWRNTATGESSSSAGRDITITIKDSAYPPMKVQVVKMTHVAGDGSETQEVPITSGKLVLKLTAVAGNTHAVPTGKDTFEFDLSTQPSDGTEMTPLTMTLPDGLSGDYILTEVSAPAGYVKTNKSYTIRVNPDNRTVTLLDSSNLPSTVLYRYDVQDKVDDMRSLKIFNEKPEYPHTGGSGTRMFTVAGCIVMLIGIAIAFGYRSKAKNK
ncbi:SpaA isopeptide-forming pilin-related protein [Alloscardovia venturai]|uniref:SpaA isopeptide-forming pilin-related protein n=1 Tax=Alloscardovia venturai TaxID=1769421 RepID=A0ABW2Y5H2_9BIFI